MPKSFVNTKESRKEHQACLLFPILQKKFVCGSSCKYLFWFDSLFFFSASPRQGVGGDAKKGNKPIKNETKKDNFHELPYIKILLNLFLVVLGLFNFIYIVFPSGVLYPDHCNWHFTLSSLRAD